VVGASARGADEVGRVRAELATESPQWVGQKVAFHVDLMSSTFFSGAPRFDLPEIPGAFLMKDGGRPVVSTEQVDGESWSIQRHDFSIYPQQSGTFTIPPFLIRFSVAPASGKPAEEQRLKSPPLNFEARLPPGAEGLSLLISTAELDVDEVWSPPIAADRALDLEVDDAITRKITVRAKDVPGMALPEIVIPEPVGAAAYPKQPDVHDEENRGQLTGERTDTVTFVCERPGVIVLPAIAIPWWDVDANELRRVKLPSVTINVSQSATAADESDGSATISDPETIAFWPLGVGLLVVCIVIVSLGYVPRRINKLLKAWKSRRAEAEHSYFAKVARGCRANDPVTTLNALMRWLEKQTAGPAPVTIAAFLNQNDNAQLADELVALQRAAVDRSGIWSGHELLTGLSKVRNSRHRLESRCLSSMLPDLNP